MYNEHVGSLSPEAVDWVGSVDPSEYFNYIDNGLLLIFGGIPWQVSQRQQSNAKKQLEEWQSCPSGFRVRATALKMEIVSFSETLAPTDEYTRR
jgi:hypothetical protein